MYRELLIFWRVANDLFNLQSSMEEKPEYDKDYGDDIRVGSFTLPIVFALEAASPAQKKILYDNYGTWGDQEKERKVKEVFHDLDIVHKMKAHAKYKRDLAAQHLDEGGLRISQKWKGVPPNLFDWYRDYIGDDDCGLA
jgi:geranylgeranyl pyrophosphate synthase